MFSTLFFSFLFSETVDQLDWSGYSWIIRNNRGKAGPGPNYFSYQSIAENGDGSLSMDIYPSRNRWYCGEIYTDDLFTYGKFNLSLELSSPLDSQAVFGFFLYNNEEPPHFNEIDYEMSRWAVPDGPESHFTVQPYTKEGNSRSFSLGNVEGRWRIVLDWRPDRIEGAIGPAGEGPVKEFTYGGSDIPTDTESRVHINFWLFRGDPPKEDGILSVRISDFTYEPYQ